MLFLVILYLAASIAGSCYIILNHKKFGPWYYAAFLVTILSFMGIVYPLFFTISTNAIFNKTFTLSIFKISIIIAIISLGALNLQYDMLFGIKSLKFIPTFFIGFMGGLIIVNLLNPNVIEIVQQGKNYYYIFDDYTLFINMIAQYLIIAYFCYIEVKIMKKVKNNKLRIFLFYLTVQFSVTILTFSIFLITGNPIVANLHIVWLGIGIINAFGVILFSPNFFIMLTHELKHLILFLKSGVLIYSYNFQEKKPLESGVLKGSIIIGISHIISNYDKNQEKIKLIRMDGTDLILDYHHLGDYGLILLANRNTKMLRKQILEFMDFLSEKYALQLKNLNNSQDLINLSDFNNLHSEINDFFQIFISGS